MQNKKNNLVIHIGYGKAGSSFLQKNFRNMDGINYFGWYFQGSAAGEHRKNKKKDHGPRYHYKWKSLRKLILQIIEPQLFTKVHKSSVEHIRKYLKKQKKKSVISTDHLSIVPSFMCAQNLKKMFPNSEILLILRKQQELISSLYRYRGYYLRYAPEPYFKRIVSFDSWINNLIKNYNKYNGSGAHRDASWEGDFLRVIDSHLLVSNFENYFGKKNIKILLYEEMIQKPEIFIKKLSSILNTDCSNLIKGINKHKVNQGYSLNHVKFLYIKDKIIKRMRLTKILFFLRPIAKKIYELLDRKENNNILFTKKQFQELKKIYSKKNNILSKKYKLNLKDYGYFT